jgi:protein subunit release factor B
MAFWLFLGCMFINIIVENVVLLEKCRSQHMNKASAMAVLQSRLDQLEIARQAQMNAEHTQSLTEISWGSQIRSYVLHVRFQF